MALLWFAFLSKRLPRGARGVLLDASANLSFSTVSLWEIGLKMSIGGYPAFKLPADWDVCIPEGLKQQGISLLTVEPGHCRRVQDLPFHHRDPFDRMLAAQCQIEGRAILSPDAIFEAYGAKRIWWIPHGESRTGLSDKAPGTSRQQRPFILIDARGADILIRA